MHNFFKKWPFTSLFSFLFFLSFSAPYERFRSCFMCTLVCNRKLLAHSTWFWGPEILNFVEEYMVGTFLLAINIWSLTSQNISLSSLTSHFELLQSYRIPAHYGFWIYYRQASLYFTWKLYFFQPSIFKMHIFSPYFSKYKSQKMFYKIMEEL